jgi:hypothetical protein
MLRDVWQHLKARLLLLHIGLRPGYWCCSASPLRVGGDEQPLQVMISTIAALEFSIGYVESGAGLAAGKSSIAQQLPEV